MKNKQYAKVGAIRKKITFSENELVIHHSLVVSQQPVEKSKALLQRT